MESRIHFLFSYGTLQMQKVQLDNYGRILDGKPDVLSEYKLKDLRITDSDVLRKSGKDVHPIAVKTGRPEDSITGTIFEITEAELAETDKYEVKDYHRVLETFNSGKKAWIYIGRTNNQGE